jgi:hypothetical protein
MYKKPLGYGTSDIRTNDTIDIISESTGKPIGFVIIGSLAYDNSTYCGSVQVLKSCIRISSLPESTFEINGNKYNMPRDLNILISGYLDISNGYIYNKFPESGDLLDSSSVVLDGGINSVNGVVGRGSIVIDMPVGSRSDVPLFKIDVDNTYTNGYTSITIGTNPEANLEDISMFTCPDSDILLDKIVGDGLDIDDVESPLDAFVAWYKHKSEEESNSGS